MAQRIKLRCLGSTMAPYTSNNIGIPKILTNSISEDISFTADQLQIGYDTTVAERVTYPLALSRVVIKYVNANHFETVTFYVTVDQDGVNNLANA